MWPVFSDSEASSGPFSLIQEHVLRIILTRLRFCSDTKTENELCPLD